TSACSGPAPARRIAPTTARRSSGSPRHRSPIWYSSGRKAPRSKCSRPWFAGVKASSAMCSKRCANRGSCVSASTARRTIWRLFPFNQPYGACPDCSGLGTRRELNADLVLGDHSLSILEGVVLPWGEPSGYLRKVVLPALAKTYKFDLNAPWRDLPPAVQKILLRGAPGKTITYQYDSERWHGSYESGWKGVLDHVEKRYSETASDAVREQLEQFMVEQSCPTCGGRRLKPESLSVLVAGKGIGDVVALPVREALDFFASIPL